MRSLQPLACAAALAIFVAAAPNMAVAASFGDGNFESPGHPGYTTLMNGGAIGPWTVTAGSVDYGTAPAQTACASGNCVDLNGNGPGAISQTFSCTPRYRVDFMMSRHRMLGRQAATIVALVNNVAVPGGTFTHGPSPAPGTWVSHTFTFTSTTPAVTLTFESTTHGNPIAAGPEIDNVAVKMVSCD